jgi:hypothetical protein
MAWIKRNLFFLIGSVIALGLLGASGFYLFEQNRANNDIKAQLAQGYSTLGDLMSRKPSPGNDKVDNISAAKAQQKEWQAAIVKMNRFFDPIPPIPASGQGTNSISDQEFASALRQTIDQLQHDAQSASVILPPQYDFSFGAIKSKITFVQGSLGPLATQLGEVKAISEILFRAKINSLDGIRRARVSSDDVEAADYIDLPSVTNDTAVITPYEITFHGFSTELAGVLSGLANSPHCFIVKTAMVEPGGSATGGPGAPGANGGDNSQMPTTAPVVYHGGLPTVLNEHPLKVTLLVDLVKLIPPAKQ